MPTYLDAHNLGNMTEEQLKQAQNLPKDEFGVTTKNMLYNNGANLLYCILDAPNKDAVQKHHQKFGLKCEWITEVKTTAWEKSVGSSGANFRVVFTVIQSGKHIFVIIIYTASPSKMDMHHIINFVKPALKS
jgi:Protein of unknown function (DUF4242)